MRSPAFNGRCYVIVCVSLYRESCSSGVSSEKHVEQYLMKEKLPQSVGRVRNVEWCVMMVHAFAATRSDPKKEFQPLPKAATTSRQAALPVPVPNIAARPLGWGSNCVPETLLLPVGHARRLSQAVASAETLRLSLRVAKRFRLATCAIPGWTMLASARVARHAACDHEKLTGCSMADYRVLRPARLQIK